MMTSCWRNIESERFAYCIFKCFMREKHENSTKEKPFSRSHFMWRSRRLCWIPMENVQQTNLAFDKNKRERGDTPRDFSRSLSRTGARYVFVLCRTYFNVSKNYKSKLCSFSKFTTFVRSNSKCCVYQHISIGIEFLLSLYAHHWDGKYARLVYFFSAL